MPKIKLNLGCGTTRLDGYINVDTLQNEFINPDIVADVRKLPFKHNSVDEIIAIHLVEHFYYWEINSLLLEWRRVLKPKGALIIECPDLIKVLKNFELYPNSPNMNMWGLYGDPTFKEPHMMHRWLWTFNTLDTFLRTNGFIDTQEINPNFHEKKRDFGIIAYKPPHTNLVFTTDDVCPSNLQYFKYWDEVHKYHPDKKVIAFTIANMGLKEPINESIEFKNWYEERKDWVEIGVHGYDHLYPPEAERDDFEECVTKSFEMLKPFLPEKYGYRSPGFKFSVRIEPILKKLGFSYVAYADRIKYFDGGFEVPINTHCCNRWDNPITEIWGELCQRSV